MDANLLVIFIKGFMTVNDVPGHLLFAVIQLLYVPHDVQLSQRIQRSRSEACSGAHDGRVRRNKGFATLCTHTYDPL